MTPVDLETERRWETEDFFARLDAEVEERPMKLYIAGPMTGVPQFNIPAFDATAEAYRDLGYQVVSPAELDDPETRQAALASEDGSPESGVVNGETWGDFLARDVKLIADEVDGVALLPGWEGSKGARLEAWLARHVGKPVFYTTAWTTADLHDKTCHCQELHAAGVGPGSQFGPDLVELDDAELDRVFTLADLSTLYKIARDEAESEYLIPSAYAPVLEEQKRRDVEGAGVLKALFDDAPPLVNPEWLPILEVKDALDRGRLAAEPIDHVAVWPPHGEEDTVPTSIWGLPVKVDPTMPQGEWRIVNRAPEPAVDEAEVGRLKERADALAAGEVRITSDTGGEKGRKPERLDLIPPEFLWELGRVYGFGASKYDDHNYLKGYDWSLSFGALLRHVTQAESGEWLDSESGLPHLAHAAWHCAALIMFERHGLGTDDRISGVVEEQERINRTGRSEAARKDG